MNSHAVDCAVTLEQLKAMVHACESEEPIAFGYMPMELEGDSAKVDYDSNGLVIEEVDDKGWIIVNYRGNAGGGGTWLATDGGWHYGPGELGYYPWREE